MPKAKKTASAKIQQQTALYKYPEMKSLLRQDVGRQPHFNKVPKPPGQRSKISNYEVLS